MSSSNSPQHLDVKAFATNQSTLSGEVDLHSMPRLRADCAEDVAGKVTWSAQGEMRQASDGHDAAWMHLQANTEVPLTCQRCLKTVEQALEVDRSFRFVKDEATAEAQDDESEEDLLVISKDFDLLALVEDELLMALPASPKHAVCPQPVKLRVADADYQEPEDKPNPFAALAGLKIPKV